MISINRQCLCVKKLLTYQSKGARNQAHTSHTTEEEVEVLIQEKIQITLVSKHHFDNDTEAAKLVDYWLEKLFSGIS